MEGAVVFVNEEEEPMVLPPGFRFHPTDEEIITHYLKEKVLDNRFIARAIGEADLNRCEPWDLPKKAKMGEKEWFFFCQRDRKYPTGMRTNRATESGYWKATGKDKEIFKGKGHLVGMKKTLVFYRGRAPKGEKTNWVMHEYRLEGKFSYHNLPKSSKEDWVVCKVFHKNTGLIRRSPAAEFTTMDSFVDHLLDSPSLPPLMDLPNTSHSPDYSSFKNGDQEEFKGPATSLTRASADENFFFNTQWAQMEAQKDQQNAFSAPNYNYKLINNHHHQASSSNSAENTIFNQQIPHPNPNFAYQSSVNHAYQHHESAGYPPSYTSGLCSRVAGQVEPKIECKMEQFSSNNSMVSISQDTGLSTDVGPPEISSVISRPENGGRDHKSFEHLDCLSVGPNISDLDSFWNCKYD